MATRAVEAYPELIGYEPVGRVGTRSARSTSAALGAAAQILWRTIVQAHVRYDEAVRVSEALEAAPAGRRRDLALKWFAKECQHV